MSAPVWLPDLDALGFSVQQPDGFCVIHRLAFRALMDAPTPTEGDCRAFFITHRAAFLTAARQKQTARRLGSDARFHLTSRDVRRFLDQGRGP